MVQPVKTGLGFDVHRFTDRKKYLFLGGVKIKCGFGVEAVSDGDVVLHAVCDALCGAVSLGDIGDYFPPRRVSSQGIKSTKIVRRVLSLMRKKRAIIKHIDVTVITEKPPLAGHKNRIKKSLQDIFHTESVNVKVKSKEGLDILGGANSISCLALVTVEEIC